MTTGQVVRLELSNFKSYAGKVTIGPFERFTCIVGPNGAGKSNLMDALSFVLGSHVTTLRGGKADDLINRNARGKEGATVSLVVSNASGHETVFSRSVSVRGDIGTSVDGHAVTEKEFALVLRKSKIGSRVSNFLVFQHEVEAVAQKKAKELTELLESVSGSGELKAEYVELKRQLDAANEHLATASVDKRGAMAEVAQLRLQKKEAERYAQVSAQLERERSDLALAELFHLEVQLMKHKRDLDAYTTEAARFEAAIGHDDDSRKLKRDIAEKHKVYLEGLRQNRDAIVELRDKKATFERIKVAVAHFEARLAKERKELGDAKSVGDTRDKEVKRLQDQLQQQEQLLAQLESQWKAEDRDHAAQHKLSDTHMVEYKKLRGEAECQTITLRQEVDTKRRMRDGLLEGNKQVQTSIDNQEAIRADITTAMQRNSQKAAEATDRVSELNIALADAQSRLEQSRAQIHQLQGKAQSRAEELKRIESQLHELRFVKEDSRQTQRQAEALSAMKAMYAGVRGRLVDLCSIPNPRYRVAVTVALGKNLDAIVVDTTETAINCVRYLKEQRLSAMTFVPLATIQGTIADDRLRTFGGTAKPVQDVMKFDPTIEPAVRFAVGATIVCDTTDEARRIAYGQSDGQRYKVVTVEGNVLNKSGAVQGGLASVQSRARKWDEKEYERLKAARSELAGDVAQGSETEEARALCEAKDLQAKAEFTKTRMLQSEKDASTFLAKNKALQQELGKIEGHIKSLRKRQGDANDQVVALESETHAILKKVAVIEAKVFDDFSKRTGIRDVSEIERRSEGLAKLRSEKRQQLTLLIHKLKTAVDTESSKLGHRSRREVESVAAATEKELDAAKKDLHTIQKVLDSSTKKTEALQAGISQAKAELDSLEEKARLQVKITEVEVRKLAATRKGVTTMQAACDAVRQQRTALYQQCRMDDIELPTAAPGSSTEPVEGGARKRGRGDTAARDSDVVDYRNIRTSEAFSSFSGETEGRQSGGSRKTGRPQEAAPTCVDFASLNDELRAAAADSSLFAALKHRTALVIQQLENDLEAIAPNLKAATGVASSEAKLGSTAAQLDEARERARKATVAFERIKEARTMRFMTMFEKITDRVDKVYQELTLGTRAHDVHGTAYLALEDAEEPYNGGTRYHATPPLKRFMTMELLSGGERTMAALALLFAIHSVAPSAPFFVLDEVDAALDIGNVLKLAEYLRSHKDTCQFIVVSLKEQLYHVADSLLGVYKDHNRDSSGTLSLDLRKATA